MTAPRINDAPLRAWRFDGRLRHYQADVLERVDVDAGHPLHIVAPPGSGKTLLGLLLAARRGRRAVVLAPTVTIRAQWADAAASLAPAGSVSQDPAVPGDFTALTYQALSVLDRADPVAQLAAARWQEELESDGRSPDTASAWLDELRLTNPKAYRSGIVRRSRTLRRKLARQDADALAAALHPNARELIDRLVAHGVDTIILDECHHLLDHWALVVATLVARLRETGRTPLVIGLTATLPSPDDGTQYENYTSLLGDVDYEVPTPAVVREGNLAPYLDLVRFVEPTPEELIFLGGHADGLMVLLRKTFARDGGLDYLVDTLQPAPVPPEVRGPLQPPPQPGPDEADARLAVAFARDFAGAEAAAAMLAMVAPEHPLVLALPDVARRPPTSEESLRLLARFALERVLPDPDRAEQWQRIRRTLADFGYALTDRGVRRARDPVDTMLASSLAKDHAVCDILRRERAELGDDRLRALVVGDFAAHGNKHGGLVGGAGALRTFDVLATDPGTRGLRALLVTGSTVRIAARDADALVPALAEALATEDAAGDAEVTTSPVEGSSLVLDVRAPGASAADIVAAAAVLLTSGTLHVVVGTRGLFGEGWDCPAVNTLIDLTAVSTASATQQLRGRTLRLDPAWPEKVAHNWTITAVLPPSFELIAAPDVSRLDRKHSRLWGLDRDEPRLIVRGLSAALDTEQRAALRAVVRREPGASVTTLEELTELPTRARTREQWRVGEDYVDREQADAVVARRPSAPVFRTSRPAARTLGRVLAGAGVVALAGLALAVFSSGPLGVVTGAILMVVAVVAGAQLMRPWGRLRRQRIADDTYRRVAAVVWDGLRRAGRVDDRRAPGFLVRESGTDRDAVSVSIECPSASLADQRTLAAALAELFGPVRAPRFLLETGRGGSGLSAAVLRRVPEGDGAHFLPVPAAIGRRREDAAAFGAAWRREIGPCELHELNTPEALALVARARRGGDGIPRPYARERWV